MRTVSIAELKARLSEFIAAVRVGDELVVTDRGRPVARLTSLAEQADARVTALVRSGVIRPPARQPGPGRFTSVLEEGDAVDDPAGRLLSALLNERQEGH